MASGDFSSRVYGLAAAVAGGTLVVASLARAVGWQGFFAPFYWLDVAVVCFFAALPLVATLAVLVFGKWAANGRMLRVTAVEALVLILIPAFYTSVRIENEIASCVELVGQSRYGEARESMRRICRLAPGAKWNGQLLAGEAVKIEAIVARLEKGVAGELPRAATDAQRMERAQNLAMLGRTEEALEVLDVSESLAKDADACNLRGTILETRGEWREAHAWYVLAKKSWERAPESSRRAEGLMRAVTGVAFNARKMGSLREAEAAWQELLSISPSADTHFLLAQFYEDVQQAGKAQLHAREAMQLDPMRYGVSGERLLNQLVTSHFGCVGILNSSSAGQR